MSLLTLQREMMGWLRTGNSDLAERIGGGPGSDVYLNNHRASLLASLGSSYPQLQRWIGEAAFEGAAAHHVEVVPSKGWTLDAYGQDFMVTLSGLYPDDPEIPDLARLVWALGEVFVAPDARALGNGDLTEIDWDKAVLHLAPSTRRLTLVTNADAIFLALSSEDDPPAAMEFAQPRELLICRADFVPRFRPLTPEEAALVDKMAEGVRFAEICETLAARHGQAEGIRLAGTYLSDWITDGACMAV
jgi:hypothetical protein